MKFSSREVILKSLKFLLAGALVYWLVDQGHLDFAILLKINAAEALCLFFLVGLNLWLCAWRWKVLLEGRGFRFTVNGAMPLQLIGVFFNFAMPGGIGGDVVKAYYIAQDHPSRRVDAVTTILMDRVIGLYAMIFMGLAAMLWNWQIITDNSAMFSVLILTAILFVFASGFLVFTFSKKFQIKDEKANRFSKIPGFSTFIKLYHAVHEYGHNKGTVRKAFVLSLGAQLVTILFMWLVTVFTGMEAISYGAYFFAIPIGLIVSAVPISPAGIGVGQAAFKELFDLYTGQSTSIGATLITVFQLGLFAWGLVGAFFYLRRRKPKALKEVTA